MSKQKKLESAGKGTFVDAVLTMLDEGTGLRELNLRKVARRVGCAHTNAYNYFTSFEDVLWWSLRGVLERMVAAADGSDGNLIDAYVDFALDHPAWYRLIWTDLLKGDPPKGVAEYLPVPAGVLTRWIEERTGSVVDGPPANRQATGATTKHAETWDSGTTAESDVALKIRLLHGYLHGELSAITAGRVDGSRSELRERVLVGAARLFQLLFHMPYSNDPG